MGFHRDDLQKSRDIDYRDKKLEKIAIMAASDSIILPNYIKELLKVKKADITVVGFQKTQWAKFYKRNHIRYIYIPTAVSKPGDLVYWLRARLYLLIYKGTFDFVHVQSAILTSMVYGDILNAGKGKMIITYWGGDIYNKKYQKFRQKKCYLDKADQLTVMISDMKEILNKEYQFRYDQKCSVLDFGNVVIDRMGSYLSRYSEAHLKKIARQRNHMPQDKIVVAIGYCGRMQQQHIKVINQISCFPRDVKKRMFLYCHMSYGVESERYLAEVGEALKQCGCAYTISEQFMNSSEIALMKIGVDIFVHAAKFDALSSSMVEYVYAGKKVFNPDWVGYRLRDELGAQDIVFSDFEDLGSKLLGALEDPEWEPSVKERNREAVEWTRSWKYVMPEWVKLYQ